MISIRWFRTKFIWLHLPLHSTFEIWLYLGRFSTEIPSMDVTVLVSSQLDLASI